MKKRCILTPVAAAVIVIACSSFVLLQQPVRYRHLDTPVVRDTIPKTEFETGRLDAAIKYLDERMRELNKEWTGGMNERIKHQIDAAMAQVDCSKARLQAMDAIKKIDWDKINRDIASATAGMSKTDIDRKVKEAIPSFDKEKIRSRLAAAMQQVDRDAIKVQIEAARKKLQDQKMNMDFHFKELTPRINNELMRTRRQLQRLKDASLQLQREGFIDKSLDNKVQYIDGRLFINGVPQSDKVSERYKHYFIQEKTPAAEGITTVVV